MIFDGIIFILKSIVMLIIYTMPTTDINQFTPAYTAIINMSTTFRALNSFFPFDVLFGILIIITLFELLYFTMFWIPYKVYKMLRG